MTIEVEAERLDEARKKAVRKLSPRAKVPGFRPGKAPADMVRRYFGEERVLDEALDDLVPIVYREAVEADESIDPVARPRLVIETTEPLVVKATIPVRPTVELGDHTSVRVPVEEVNVEESRVDETLLLLRRRAATLEPIERPIAWRDVVRMHVEATVDGETLVEPQEAEVQLVEGREALLPGFEDAIIGSSKGDEVTFDLRVPESFQAEKFRGKPASFKVQIIETKEEVLPELDDDFVKAVGEGFDSVDALRDRIRDDIRKTELEQIENRYHDQILGQLVEQATIEYPPVMLDSEVDRLIHDQTGHLESPDDFQRYLAAMGKTEEQIRQDFRPIADTRLRRSLVLSQVAEAEYIQVAPGEIDAEIEKLTAASGGAGGGQAEQLRSLFGSERGRDTIERNLLTRKTLARLVEIATQDAAVPAAEAQRPAKKKRASKKAGAAAEATAASEGAEGEATT